MCEQMVLCATGNSPECPTNKCISAGLWGTKFRPLAYSPVYMPLHTDPQIHVDQPSVARLFPPFSPRSTPKASSEPRGGFLPLLFRPTGSPKPRETFLRNRHGPLKPCGTSLRNRPGPPKPRGTSLTNQPRLPKTRGRSSKSSSPSHLVSILSGSPPKTPIMSQTWLHLKRPNLRTTLIFQKKIVAFIDPT
jgi:hypothetical protein